MKCSYCNIAYALPDPNCRGCGAPKTADAISLGLDRQSLNRTALFSGGDSDDDGFMARLERLQNIGPAAIGAIVVTILGIVWLLGPGGLLTLAILFPKMKAEWATISQSEKRSDAAGNEL